MDYIKKRNLILVIIVFLVGLLAGSKVLAPKFFINNDNQEYLVLDVIDGDTIKIAGDMRVRLLSIDSPEKGECYYQEAKSALDELIANKVVRLEKDITDKDRYGRWLRYVILPVENQDNILVNDYLVRHGDAIKFNSPPNNRYQSLLTAAQEQAKRNNLGLWGMCDQSSDENSTLREVNSEPTDPKCNIKGNISEKGYGKTYLIPGCDNYNSVKIDSRKGEAYFCSEAEAQAAGFRKATNCP